MGAGITVNYQNPVPLFNIGFWKVSSAQHKTTNQNVSLWQIDYDAIQKTEKKQDREKFLNGCLLSVQQMRRIHHPLVLKIFELSESIKALNFAAEPIVTCLAYEDSFTPDDASFVAYQMAQVLKFVHQNAHLVLFGLSPDAIVLTSTLDLKLCNFTFASPIINEFGISVLRTGEWHSSPFNPKLNFTAPEVLNGLQTSVQADVFSFALSIANAYIGRPPFECATIEEYIRAVQQKMISFTVGVPQEVRDLIFNCISLQPDRRPTLDQVLKSPIFDSLALKALQYIEIIVTKTDEDRYTFYKGIAKTLSAFSIRILQSRFLPLFIKDILRESRFGPVLAPQIFEIGRSLDNYSFMNEILTPLTPLFTSSDKPDCLLAILASIPSIIERIDESQYHSILFPMLQAAFSSSISAIHNEALKHIPLMISKMSNASIESELIPTVIELFTTSDDSKIVSSCIKCLAGCLPKLNHDLFSERVTGSITAAWNRLAGPPEIAEATLEIVRNLNTSPTISIKYVVPMVSELLASERIDPPVQLLLGNYIIDVVTRVKTGAKGSTAQWLNRANKSKEPVKPKHEPVKTANVMSIDQFQKTVSTENTSRVNFSSIRRPSTENPDELTAVPRRQSENQSTPNLFAGMKTTPSGEQGKRGSTNSMFSGLNVGAGKK